MSDSHEAVFRGINTVLLADTAAGGINNTSTTWWLRSGAFRTGDPTRVDSTNFPRLDVEIQDAERDGFSLEKFEGVVRFHIFTRRDRGFSDEANISERLRTLFHRTRITDTSAVWTYTNLRRSGGQAARPDGTTLHRVEQYAISAFR